MISFVEQRGSLYLMNCDKKTNAASFYAFSSFFDVGYKILHVRLCYIDLKNFGFLKYINVKTHDMNEICVICPLAKQNRLPFPVSVSNTSCAFELIHCDVWGPFPNDSYGGYKYFDYC